MKFDSQHASKMTAIANYLRKELGFKDPLVDGVYISPRFRHDFVVDVASEAPRLLAKQIRKHASELDGTALRELTDVAPAPLSGSCLQHPPAETIELEGSNQACLLCNSHPADHESHPVDFSRLHSQDELGGSNMFSFGGLADLVGGAMGKAKSLVGSVGDTFMGTDNTAIPHHVEPVAPRYKHMATMVWLHGLGDDGPSAAEGMRDVTEQFPFVKFIFPSAPTRSITIMAGIHQRGWFDVKALDFEEHHEDKDGIETSAAVVHEIFAQEHAAGIPYNRMFVGGFSQGGAIAMFSGLTSPHKLGGIVCTSSYVPLQHVVKKHLSAKQIPKIFYGHGTADVLIPFGFAQRSREFLQPFLGDYLTFYQYEGQGHTIAQDEASHIRSWLTSRFKELLSH